MPQPEHDQDEAPGAARAPGASAEPSSRPAAAPVRIGELSRRVGVPAETLRAWERRYAVLEPQRSPAGYRLYDAEDESRVRAMTALMRTGTAPAEAARIVRDGGGRGGAGARSTEPLAGDGVPPGARVGALVGALERFDDPAAHAIFDRAVAELSIEAVVAAVAMPALREIGERWEAGRLTIAQEHFASNLLRGRLVGLGRGWGSGAGPLALLACPPGEHHDLGLVSFGVILRQRGWRVALLGADTPARSIAETAETLDPAIVVVAAIDRGRLENAAAELRSIAERHALLLGGAGASPELAAELGARLLPDEPLAGADAIAR